MPYASNMRSCLIIGICLVGLIHAKCTPPPLSKCTPAVEPPPPSNARITQIGAYNATIEWDKPDCLEDEEFDGFGVSISKLVDNVIPVTDTGNVHHTDWKLWGKSTRKAQLSNLEPGTEYLVSLVTVSTFHGLYSTTVTVKLITDYDGYPTFYYIWPIGIMCCIIVLGTVVYTKLSKKTITYIGEA